jgi:hypothetical protein
MAWHETRTRARPGVAALVWTGGTPAARGELRLKQRLVQEFGQGEKREVGSLLGQPGQLVVAEQATVGLCIGKVKRERAGPARGRNSVSAQTTRKLGNHFFLIFKSFTICKLF